MNDSIENEKAKIFEKLEFLRSEARKEREKIQLAAEEFATKVFPDENARFYAWMDVVARWEAIDTQARALDGQIGTLREYEEQKEKIERAIKRIRVHTEVGALVASIAISFVCIASVPRFMRRGRPTRFSRA